MTNRVYYFGCWGSAKGHYLHDECGNWQQHGRRVGRRNKLPFEKIDGVFCPGLTQCNGFYVMEGEELQGAAKLTHAEGWTVLAFWDRSVDTRYGSNSTFFIEGTHSALEAMQIAKDAFPAIWARYKFVVRPL